MSVTVFFSSSPPEHVRQVRVGYLLNRTLIYRPPKVIPTGCLGGPTRSAYCITQLFLTCSMDKRAQSLFSSPRLSPLRATGTIFELTFLGDADHTEPLVSGITLFKARIMVVRSTPQSTKQNLRLRSSAKQTFWGRDVLSKLAMQPSPQNGSLH